MPREYGIEVFIMEEINKAGLFRERNWEPSLGKYYLYKRIKEKALKKLFYSLTVKYN